MNFMIRDLDNELWNRFKILTIMEKPRVSLNERIKKLIEDEVRLKSKRLPGRRE
jgi:hypothetical protein